MKSVATALESYKATNGSYPIAPAWRTASGCGGWTQVTPNDAIPGLAPQYIIAMPTDPSMNNTSRSCYLYYSDGSDYKFLVHDVAEMTAADYLRQPNYMDPTRDRGSDGCIVDGASPWSWAIWTNGFRCQ